jgi:hypothetical protein
MGRVLAAVPADSAAVATVAVFIVNVADGGASDRS